jgi:hypothetical protein
LDGDVTEMEDGGPVLSLVMELISFLAWAAIQIGSPLMTGCWNRYCFSLVMLSRL